MVIYASGTLAFVLTRSAIGDIWALFMGGIISVILLSDSWVAVDKRHVALVSRLGHHTGRVLMPGWHLHIPFMENVFARDVFNIGDRGPFTVKCNVTDERNRRVALSIDVTWRPDLTINDTEDELPRFISLKLDDYDINDALPKEVETLVDDLMAGFNPVDIYTQSETVKKSIAEILPSSDIPEYFGIDITRVTPGPLAPSKEVREAYEKAGKEEELRKVTDQDVNAMVEKMDVLKRKGVDPELSLHYLSRFYGPNSRELKVRVRQEV